MKKNIIFLITLFCLSSSNNIISAAKAKALSPEQARALGNQYLHTKPKTQAKQLPTTVQPIPKPKTTAQAAIPIEPLIETPSTTPTSDQSISSAAIPITPAISPTAPRSKSNSTPREEKPKLYPVTEDELRELIRHTQQTAQPAQQQRQTIPTTVEQAQMLAQKHAQEIHKMKLKKDDNLLLGKIDNRFFLDKAINLVDYLDTIIDDIERSEEQTRILSSMQHQESTEDFSKFKNYFDKHKRWSNTIRQHARNFNEHLSQLPNSENKIRALDAQFETMRDRLEASKFFMFLQQLQPKSQPKTTPSYTDLATYHLQTLVEKTGPWLGQAAASAVTSLGFRQPQPRALPAVDPNLTNFDDPLTAPAAQSRFKPDKPEEVE